MLYNFKFCTRVDHIKYYSFYRPTVPASGRGRDSLIHFGLRKFRHSKSSVWHYSVVMKARQLTACGLHPYDSRARCGLMLVDCNPLTPLAYFDLFWICRFLPCCKAVLKILTDTASRGRFVYEYVSMIISLPTWLISVTSLWKTFIAVIPTRWRRKPAGRDWKCICLECRIALVLLALIFLVYFIRRGDLARRRELTTGCWDYCHAIIYIHVYIFIRQMAAYN